MVNRRAYVLLHAVFERAAIKRFSHFAAVGAIGFLADSTVLLLAIPLAGHYGGRVVSFGAAVVVTWWLNRMLTFRDRRSTGRIFELTRYVGSQSIGATTNLVLYTVCVAVSQRMHDQPLLALAIGSAAGLIVNYTLAHRVVFR